LNEKPGQTDFCSQQMPVEAQSDSLAVGSTATASDTGGSTKKKKHSKISLCPLHLACQNHPKKKIKKHISSMLGFQAKSAKNNAAKDELSLLQMKLAAAKDNLRNASDSDDQNKYIAMVKKLQGK
jgi:hypothetical protein